MSHAARLWDTLLFEGVHWVTTGHNSMPNINPNILIWARETAGLSREAAAKKIGLKPARGMSSDERLAALEAGTEPPSRPILLKLAKTYRRPLLVFYMDNPPPKGDRGTDFRTLPADYSTAEDALLDALIRDVSARQSMVRAVLESEEEAIPVSVIGSMSMEDGVGAVVASVRNALGIDLIQLRAETAPETAFALLRERAEHLGIFVLLIGNLGSHHSTISVDTFRGLAFADPIAPFVVINDQDSKSAWSFSLLHELAHLWLGQTGISGIGGERAIEQFCNDAAAEFLLPATELTGLEVTPATPRDRVRQFVEKFARDRNISNSMVAYRLYRARLVTLDTWRYLSDSFRQHWLASRSADREKARSQEGGPSYYVLRRHRLGAGLVRLVGRMVSANALTTTKAATILGVKPQSVQALLGEDVRALARRAA